MHEQQGMTAVSLKMGARRDNNIVSDEQTVFVVDDDAAVRDSLSWLIKSVGLRVETYGSAQEFLEAYDPKRSGCVVLDVRMPGMSGLELQEKLKVDKVALPVIIITGHGDVPMAVRAVKAGAFDFIEKPFHDQTLLDRIQQALKREVESRKLEEKRSEVEQRLALLTPREREVLDLVVCGNPNKVIAAQLGISCRTVEIHRGRVMEKMQANSLSDLVRIGLTSGLF
jgi:RNA polymerase sigma factor (sigma-70 family)